jgi:phosphatidylserine/phosphatidylglycerophosphate/cardiolipin synthase-like enzyme
MIGNAKHSLNIEQFYISNQTGEPLEVILLAIREAGIRGVNVQIIADSRMYRTYPEMVDSLGKMKNIAARVIDFGKFGGGIQHAKFFIVDGEEIFLGSQNFDWRALKHIHELGLRIRNDEIVKVYNDIFELDWKFSEKNDPKSTEELLKRKSYGKGAYEMMSTGETIQITPTMSPKNGIIDSTLWDEQRITGLINNAQQEVLLQFLSYSTTGRDRSVYTVLDDAIRNAAARGVRVKMIVSDWEKGSPGDAPLKSLAKVPNVEVKFSALPEWSGGYISYARVEHCKFIVADDNMFWLGTSNAEKSYFHTSRNLGIIVSNPGLTRQLRHIFFKSWDGPYTESVKPDVEYKPREHAERK